MKKFCTLLMAVLFLSFTAVSAQDATTKKSKKGVKKELGQKLKKDATVDKRDKQGAEATQATGPKLKKDGTVDMRYKENRDGLHKGTKRIKKR